MCSKPGVPGDVPCIYAQPSTQYPWSDSVSLDVYDRCENGDTFAWVRGKRDDDDERPDLLTVSASLNPSDSNVHRKLPSYLH